MIPRDGLLPKRIRQGMNERADLGDGEEAGAYVDETLPTDHNNYIEGNCIEIVENRNIEAADARLQMLTKFQSRSALIL